MNRLLYFFVLLIPFACLTEEMRSLQPQRLTQIDRELDELQKERHSLRQVVMKKELEAQNLMIDDWKGAAKKIEEMQDHEKEVYRIEKKIEGLEQEKQTFFERTPH